MKNNTKKWELNYHSSQIADTGDYSGSYELTNGDITLYCSEDDVDEELESVVESLNASGCKFYIEDARHELELANAMIKELQKENDRLNKCTELDRAIDKLKYNKINVGHSL